MIENQMYTKKQNQILERALNEDWFLMINHGAVRSGKTMLDNDLFLMELLRTRKQADLDDVHEPMYILGAVSSGTLYTNVLQELTNKYRINFKFDRHGNFTLFGVKVITTYTGTIAGLGAIRGLTSYGAYINEASLANRSVFDEIIKRCSGEGARILCDTNPEHPKHWLKTDYIDKADGKKIIENHFTLFDNNFLGDRYVQNLIATTPSGTLSDRGIYGLWTVGEGAIYKDYDPKVHLVNDFPPLKENEKRSDQIKRYFCGVDWGYEHKGVILVIAELHNGDYYVIEEHAHQYLHINDWIDIGKDIANRYGEMTPFYCDSARPEYVDSFYYAGLNAMNASKSILSGITEVGMRIKTKTLYFFESCKETISEIGQYVWNKTGDLPLKELDDCMDALRYAIYTQLVILQQG